MRRIPFVLLVLLWPTLQSTTFLPNRINFLTGPLPAVQDRAEREQKLYFIHFTAKWCLPCQWMEENTYADPTLADYVHRYYLPVKLNIDFPEGAAYKEEYEVVSLPTVLIFDAGSRLLDRYEESLNADRLLAILQSHNQPENRNDRVRPPKPTVPDVPAAYSYAVRPDNRHYSDRPTPTPAAAPSSVSQPTPLSKGAYTVQAGAYGEYANAQAQARRIKNRIPEAVNLQTTRHGGRSIYRVMIGQFATEAEAERYLTDLRRQGIQGFVKDTRKW